MEFVLKGIKGNGTALGITDATNYAGIFISNGNITTSKVGYGKATGTAYGQQQKLPDDKYLGLTSDSTKSGLDSEIDSHTKYIIKY